MTLWIKQGYPKDTHSGWNGTFLPSEEATDLRGFKLLGAHLFPEV